MSKSIKFIAFFTLFFIPLCVVVGGVGLLGVLLSSCLCAYGAEKLSRSTTQTKGWGVILLSAGICATMAGAFFSIRIYLLAMAVSITGSPYDVPEINYLRIFLLAFGSAFVSTATVLAICRRKAIRQSPI